jgi:myosin heavy subunit
VKKLEDELDHLRRNKLELESLLLQRDNKIFETRYDMDTYKEEIQRLQRRNSELELAFTTLQAVAANALPSSALTTGGGGGMAATGFLTGAEELLLRRPLSEILGEGGGAGVGTAARPFSRGKEHGGGGPSHIASSKREQELINLVETLKKIIDKFKMENDRLKRGITGPSGQLKGDMGHGQGHPGHNASLIIPGEGDSHHEKLIRRTREIEKKYSEEKKKTESLINENHQLQSKCHEMEEKYLKLQQKVIPLQHLQKQLKSKENEISIISQEILQFKIENENLLTQITMLQEKLEREQRSQQQQHQQQQQPQGGKPSTETTKLSTENDLLNKEIKELRKKLTLQASEIMNLRENYATTLGGTGGGGGGGGKDKDKSGKGSGGMMNTLDLMELNRLKDENVKLKEELSAFDLDFFEEIENLKFAHAEAIRKLKLYEREYGSLSRR